MTAEGGAHPLPADHHAPFFLITMWITLTVDQLRDRLTSTEVAALRSVQVEGDQTDPAEEALRRSIDEARGYLGVRPESTLGPAGTVPPQLEGAVLDIARYRLCTRLAVGRIGETLLSESRTQEYKDALRLLRDMADGKFAVEDPVNLSESIHTTPSPRMNPRSTPQLP